MNLKHFLAALQLAAAVIVAGPARASEGHDHGAAPTATGSALPRFTAVSETFELVGVLNGTQLSLYLDRFADNAPVKGATLELEIGGTKVAVEPRGEGEFAATLAAAPKPGVTPVTATIAVGDENDLLAGDLDVHAATHADGAAHRHSWKEWITWGVGGLLALVLLAWAARQVLATRAVRAGGAA